LKGALNVKPILKIVGGLLGAAAIGGGFFLHSQQDALIQKAVPTIEEKISEQIGTQIKIGKVEVEELNFAGLKTAAW